MYNDTGTDETILVFVVVAETACVCVVYEKSLDRRTKKAGVKKTTSTVPVSHISGTNDDTYLPTYLTT